MGKRIVIALGGNALGKNLHEQMDAVHVTAKAIADLIQDGHEVVIAHGNGPQVGMIQNAFAAYHKQEAKSDIMPLSMCVAMSQGYIGYDLQNALKEELLNRGLQQGVATVLTQVVVDGNDPAFQHPTKPIGAFMSKEEAEKMAREKGWHIAEDAGRGWRQVVASPKPMAVVELTTIRALAEADNVVIACGGGGIPVIATDHHHLKGAAAVIDKDLASELLAEHLDADMLIILTAVEKVAVNFNKPNQKWLDALTPEMFLPQLQQEKQEGWVCYLHYTRDVPDATVSVHHKTGQVEHLFVTESARGRGIGQKMLDFARKKLPEHEHPVLTVLNTNTRALALYRRMGWQVVGAKEKFDPAKDPLLVRPSQVLEMRYQG